MILIIGCENSYKVRKVVEKLRKKKANFKVLDFTSQPYFTADFRAGFDNFMVEPGLELDDIKVVWKTSKFQFKQLTQADERIEEYTKMNMRLSVDYRLLDLLPGKKINPSSIEIYSNNKLLQLKLAKKVGFDIPETFISNNLAAIRDWKGQNSCIIKSLGDNYIPCIDNDMKQKSMMTMDLNDEYLEQATSVSEPFPLYIQKKIDKKFEYRVIFINGKFFTFRINPYESKIMEVDNRQSGLMVNYQPVLLPSEIEHQISSFAYSINLFTGCFDLIEDQFGNFIFLEVNPDGVWDHHDNILDGAISEEFSRKLMSLDEHLTF